MRTGRTRHTSEMSEVWVDAGDGMAALGEVAVWGFDLAVWGECTQAATEAEALTRYRRRTGRADLRVVQRITRPAQVFDRDLAPASDDEVEATIAVLGRSRARTLALLRSVPPELLDAADPAVRQPTWMPWRTPAAIGRHIADTESRGYPRRLGLPVRDPLPGLEDELAASAQHIERVLRAAARDRIDDYKGETWTTVKLLRRLAWHERVELVFLRRRVARLMP